MKGKLRSLIAKGVGEVLFILALNFKSCEALEAAQSAAQSAAKPTPQP